MGIIDRIDTPLVDSVERSAKSKLNITPRLCVLGDAFGNMDNGIPTGTMRVREKLGGSRFGPVEIVRSGVVGNYIVAPGSEVWIGKDLEGQDAILQASWSGLVKAGVNPGVLNGGDNRIKFFSLANITELLTVAPGSANTPGTEVHVYPYLRLDQNNQLQFFPGEIVDLAAYIPAAGLKRIVALFLGSDNTIAVTQSSTINVADVFSVADFQECFNDMPPDSIEVSMWQLGNGQTSITSADKLEEIRPLFGRGTVRNTLDSSSDPTVTNDETEGYGVRSIWVNGTSGNVFFCIDPATGAAVWEIINASGILEDAVILAPDSTDRNLIIPTVNTYFGLRIQAASGQTSGLFRVEDDTPNAIFQVNGSGSTSMTGGVLITGNLDLDNMFFDGNDISTQNTNGNLTLTPNGTGKVVVGGGGLTVDTNLIIADAAANTVDIVGAVGVTGDLDVDNVNINGNTISTTDTNGNLNLTPNGTGKVNVGADGLIVDTDLIIADASANTVDMVGAVGITGDLDVDNLNLDGNTLSSTNTDGNITLDPNGTGYVDALSAVHATVFNTNANATINDDAVATWTIGTFGRGIIEIVPNNAVRPMAILWFRNTASNTPVLMGGANTANLNLTTGVLSGTTGTDGRLNVSVWTDGVVYVENRLGVTVNYTIFVRTVT